MAASDSRPNGIGLGLRWEFLDELVERTDVSLAFLEVSPENYMGRGGHFPAQLERLQDRFRFTTHGLTLSLGGTTDADDDYLRNVAEQIRKLKPCHHSDHLCFSAVGPLILHDLLPVRFSKATAQRVADRMRELEDRWGIAMAVENISWYAHLGKPELTEAAFIQEVVQRSGGGLLLDVNNVYVNASNHGFDAHAFIDELPLDRVVQLHVAGHTRRQDGWIIDTHGESIIDPVYDLLEYTLSKTGPLPVLLERDNNIPPLNELLREVARLQQVYAAVQQNEGWDMAPGART